MKNQLVERWNALIESPKAKVIANKEAAAQMLENQEQYVVEQTPNFAGDMAQYTPILVPAVRRIFPNLLANEIVGVQPMTTPTGYAYALRYSYGKGVSADQLGTASPNFATNRASGNFNTGLSHLSASNHWGSQILLNNSFSQGVIGSIVPGDTVNSADASNTIVGTIVYAGADGIVINLASNSTKWSAGALYVYSAAAADKNITFTPGAAVDGSEAAYNSILKNFSGPVTTATGEGLRLSDGTMKTMKMSLERVAIEAQTRKLAAEYTIELAQDLKAVHGLDAEAELINILEYEVAAELDRELVAAINTSAYNAGSWTYAVTASGTPAFIGQVDGADGRWEMERFRSLYTRIVNEANKIALTSRRGAGNFIITTVNVISALEVLPNFMYAAVPGDVKFTFGVGKVGTIDGRFAVYLDTFATSDYVTVGYKGPSQFDTGVIYCPYIPLMLQKVTDPDTLQPKLGFMTRDAIAGNLFGASNYYRKFTVTFTGSSLIANAYPTLVG